MNDMPLVSVIMPNYNTPEEYLRAAIESVLFQSYSNIELIIVDDASTSGDIDIIKSYRDNRIKLMRNEKNMHVAYTLNRGLEAAAGEFIARMDSDDVCLSRRIEKQVRFLMKNKTTDILSSRARFTGAKKGVFAVNIRDPEKMKTEVFFGCPVFHPSVMFRASFINKNALRYNTDAAFKAAEDYELWSRCVFLGHMREYPKVLLLYRVHLNQVSSSSLTLQRGSANNVRAGMLAKMGIIPNYTETDTHLSFCNGLVPESFERTENWARSILEANAANDVFDKKLFRRAVLRRFFVVTVKSLLCNKISLISALKSPLFRSALMPVNYPGIIKRYFFSKRLNKKGGLR